MALATQCPHCHTSFRVANDQLKLHAGLVRCGQCQQTFNGIENLLTPDGSAATIVNSADTASPSPAQNLGDTALPPQSTEVVAETSIDLDASLESGASNTPTKIATNLGTDEFLVADDTSIAMVTPATEEPRIQDSDIQEASDEEIEQLPSSVSQGSSDFDSLDFDLGDDAPAWSKNEPSFPQEGELSSAVQAEASHADDKADQAFDHTDTKAEVAEDTDSLLNAGEDEHERSECEATGKAETALTSSSEIEELDEDESEKPNFVIEAEKKQRAAKWQSVCFALLILIFVLSGLGQGVYFFRSAIAAHFPTAKAPLLQICQKLKCQIRLPAQKEFLEISGKELQNESTELHLQVLTVQIQNNSNTLQAWPMLELVLQDARQKPLLQRAFAPSEYLEDKTMLAKGIPANSEQNIKVYFENATIKANNFTVDLFYP